MKIIKLAHARELNVTEFKRLKKGEPFNSYRNMAKGLNFGLLFGMSYKTYSATRLETAWTQKQCDDFIDEHHLMDSKWDIAKYHKNESPHLWSYYAVSKFFRDSFFKTYKGLLKRIDWRREEGKQNGYIRSLNGAIRHTLPLQLGGKDDNRKTIGGYLNIAANTDIQNDEAVRVMLAITEFNEVLKSLNLKSKIIGTIHDSVDFMIYKEELEFLYKNKIVPIFEKMEDWQTGIPLTIDFTVVDLTKGDQYYKHGKDIAEVIKL